MKVYVVIKKVDYEGEDVLRIYSTKEAANKYCRGELNDDWRVQDGHYFHCRFCDNGFFFGEVSDVTYYVYETEVHE